MIKTLKARVTPAIVILVFLVSATGSPTDSSSTGERKIHVEANELLTIGLTDADLLGQPVDVATDSEGRIYVADQIGPAVRVFSRKGDSLHVIGRRGRGPGELQRPTTLHVTPNDRLIVADHGARRLTAFETDGTYEQVWSRGQARSPWVTPGNIAQLDESTFIFEGLLRDVSGAEPPDKQLHVVRLKKSGMQVGESFFSPKDLLGELSPQYEYLMGLTGGSLLLERDGLVLYSPHPYNGEIFVFDRTTDGTSWQLQARWEGHVETEAPYNAREPDHVDKDEPSWFRFSSMKSGEPVTVAGLLHNTSHGLYRLQEGYIVHFTQIRHEGDRQFGVEVYNTDGTFEGYTPLPNVAEEGFGRTPVVAWKDAQDRFYVITTEGKKGLPLVRVIALEIST